MRRNVKKRKSLNNSFANWVWKISYSVKAIQLEWIGHIWQAEESLPRQVLVDKENEKHPRDRRRQLRMNKVINDQKEKDESASIESAKNRDWWRDMVEAVKGLNSLWSKK